MRAMEQLKDIVDGAMGKLAESISADRSDEVAKVIEAAVIRGVLEGQRRAMAACEACTDTERHVASKIADAIRRQNEALIANLSSLR